MIFKFNDKKILKTAVKLWCNRYTHKEALEKYGDISTWNVSNIDDMSKLFKGTRRFNDDIGHLWDVGRKVTNMDAMFYECKSFDQDISNWNVDRCY